MRYEPPHRPQSVGWRTALLWWRRLDDKQRLELRRIGLRKCVDIVSYYQRGGR